MTKYNSEQIQKYIYADLTGKRDILVTLKKKASKEIHHHLAKLKKCLGPQLISDPNTVYPHIAEHFYRIGIAVRKVSISSTLLVKFLIDGLEIARENYHKSPNELLKNIILDLEHHILPEVRAYYEKVVQFRQHIPLELKNQIIESQIFPSKHILHFLVALDHIEKEEKKIANLIKQFFHKYKTEVKELIPAVNNVAKGRVNVVGKFAASHPPTVVGTICLCFTIIGYVGVFVTLGYGIAGVLGGSSIIASLFGVSRGMGGLKLLGNMFFSSGTSTMAIIVDKGIGLLQMS